MSINEEKEQLNEVNKAINTILAGGQSYKIGTRSLTRADLSTLYAMKKELEDSVSSTNGGGLGRATALGFFDRR